METFTAFAQEHVGLLKQKPRSTNPGINKTNDPTFIQRTYRQNKKKAASLITEEKQTVCSIAKEDLIKHFFSVESPDMDLSVFDSSPTRETTPDIHPFNPVEVKTRIKTFDNTAPGNDRLTYKHWLGVDCDGKVLAAIFNICMKARRISASWKESTTIFIPKSGDPKLAKNWRPIALCPTVAKIYSGLLMKRINEWIEREKVLSTAQKGFRPFDGCFEHTFIIEERLRQAQHLHEELCLLSVDISNAFGSVAHPAIRPAITKQGIGDWFGDILADMYNGVCTHLLTSDGLSDILKITIGVKQGEPASGVLFNLYTNPIVCGMQEDADEFHTVAIADDYFLSSKSLTHMQA